MKLIVLPEMITLRQFTAVYLERYAKIRKASWEKDTAHLRRNILPVLGDFPLDQITSHQVSSLHADIGMRAPYEANRTVEVLRSVFKCALQWGLLPKSFDNPTDDIQKFKEKKRTRWLTNEELKQLAPILMGLEPHFCVYYWSLILTGCRSTSEMKKLKWTDVDFKNANIYFGKTKNGDPQLLPVPPELVAMICSLQKNSEYVFPSCRYDKKWRQIRRLIPSLHDVRLHDLRHTTASHLLQQGHSLRVVGDVLNHRTLEATNRYAHLSREHLRAPINQLAASMPLPVMEVEVEALEEEEHPTEPRSEPLKLASNSQQISPKFGTVETVPGTKSRLQIRHNKYSSVYYVSYYMDGVHKHETIGKVDEITEAEARTKCELILKEKENGLRPNKRPQKMQYYVWDEDTPCFGVRHNKRSAKYVAKYRVHGTQVLITVGDVNLMTREEARESALNEIYCAKQESLRRQISREHLPERLESLEQEMKELYRKQRAAVWTKKARQTAVNKGLLKPQWDEKVPELFKVCYGQKTSWILRLRFNQKERRLTLGSVDVLSESQARTTARKILAKWKRQIKAMRADGKEIIVSEVSI